MKLFLSIAFLCISGFRCQSTPNVTNKYRFYNLNRDGTPTPTRDMYIIFQGDNSTVQPAELVPENKTKVEPRIVFAYFAAYNYTLICYDADAPPCPDDTQLVLWQVSGIRDGNVTTGTVLIPYTPPFYDYCYRRIVCFNVREPQGSPPSNLTVAPNTMQYTAKGCQQQSAQCTNLTQYLNNHTMVPESGNFFVTISTTAHCTNNCPNSSGNGTGNGNSNGTGINLGLGINV